MLHRLGEQPKHPPEFLELLFVLTMMVAVFQVPIRGSLLRYNCDREGRNVSWGRAEPGANCVSFLEVNAAGYCYKTTAGVWNCSMSDLAARKTEKVAPPK